MESMNQMPDKEQFIKPEDAHTLLLYLLKQVNDITEKEHIPYFAHGGTLLGTIRHQGFIPWDDDIDLIIERRYYKQFVEACERLLPPGVLVRTRENDPFFCEEYIKICFSDEIKKFSELSVDVFILDETNPDRKIFRKCQSIIIRNLRYIKLYKASRKAEYLEPYIPNNIFKRISLSVLQVMPLRFITDLQTKAMLAEKKGSDWYVDWGSSSPYGYKGATWPKKNFNQNARTSRKFEDTYIYIPGIYEGYLISSFGEDYMTLPPVEKRQVHGYHNIANPLIKQIINQKSDSET